MLFKLPLALFLLVPQGDLTDMAKYFKLDAGMLDLSVRGEQTG